MKELFVEFRQNYYLKPIINKDLGMNEVVYVEVDSSDMTFDDCIWVAEDRLEKIGYDLEEFTNIDPYSDCEYKVWEEYGIVDIFGIMERSKKNYSIILLNGQIKNF
jgi:hypothetical protein